MSSESEYNEWRVTFDLTPDGEWIFREGKLEDTRAGLSIDDEAVNIVQVNLDTKVVVIERASNPFDMILYTPLVEYHDPYPEPVE